MFISSCSGETENTDINASERETELYSVADFDNSNNISELKYDLNIIYKTIGERDLKLDIFYPVNKIHEKSPVIIGFHGGGWVAGDKSQILYIYSPVIEKLRENGYTVVTAQYRLASGSNSNPENNFPAQIQDCIDSILYLKNNAEKYGVDIDSVGVMGYSAGAHLAMLASYAMSEFSVTGETVDIKYCVSAAGPSKFYGDEAEKYPVTTLNLLEALFGGKYTPENNNYITGSPYYYIGNTQSKTPLLLIHDENDRVVPFSQSEIMFEKAEEVNIPRELLILNGVWHSIDFSMGYSMSPPAGECIDIILDFIYKYS